MKKQTSKICIFSIIAMAMMLFFPANMALSESISTSVRIQKTIEGPKGQSLIIDADVSDMPEELYTFSLTPVAMSKIDSIIRAVYGNEASDIQESKDGDYQLSYRLINQNAAPGTLNAFASLDIFPKDQSIAFIDYRRNINGEDVEDWNAPNCNLTRDDAIEQAADFLEALGVQSPVYIEGSAVRSTRQNEKGYYRLIFTPMYHSIGFAMGVTGGGGSMLMPSYPKVSMAISDEGIFSLNGRFLYEAKNEKRVESPLDSQAAVEKLILYINSGLISNVAPLPVESITLEHFAMISADGGYTVRPVWAIRSDPSKMKLEWYQAGMYLMNLFIYADDGSIAAM